MDSFELNKILGAILATCLVVLVTSFADGAIFTPVMPEKPGYEIAVKEVAHGGGKDAAPAAPSEPIEKLLQTASVEKGSAAAKKWAACHTFGRGGPRRGEEDPARGPRPEPIEKLLQTASVEKGSAAAKKCAACHTFEKGGPNRVGPNLFGIVERARATEAGFNYSAAMKGKGGEWTYDDLNKFIDNPKGFVPGTAMGFAGIQKDSERADVIAYLRTLADSPVPLPTASK